MRIKMKRTVSRPGLILNAGETADRPDDEANRLIQAGSAKRVRNAKAAKDSKGN